MLAPKQMRELKVVGIRSILALAFLSAAKLTQAAPSTTELAIKFGERESFDRAALSPDGSRVSYITPISGRGSALMMADTRTGEVKAVLTTGDPKVRLRSCFWVKTDRLICRLSTVSNALGTDLFGVSRLYSISPDGTDLKEVGAKLRDGSFGINQNSGDVIDSLPDDPDHVLMSAFNFPKETTGSNMRPKPAGLAVQRVNVRTGRMQMVEQPVRNGQLFMTDATGAVRVKGVGDVKETAEGGSSLQSEFRYFYRSKGSNDWQPLGKADRSANLTLSVEGFDESGDWLYLYKPLNGRLALYKFATDGSNRESLVFSRNDADLDGVRRIGKFSRPIGVEFETDYGYTEYFDTAIGDLTTRLKKALPGNPGVKVIGETWDGTKLFVYAGSDVDPGGYYIYDKSAKRLAKLSSARPKLEGVAIARQKPVTYTARDGTKIPAYITLPPNQEAAKGLPAVIMPHGGPAARDSWGYDWLSQYYTQLGYVVIQPNYRGSAGYGEAWYQDGGFKGWRTAMEDINDSARWLIAQGIADPKRMAIVGWSYGGYAALQANVLDPDLYKAIIAVAPVTDFQKLKDESYNFQNYRLVAGFIGSGSHIVEGSPARNAGVIKAPVLMFHGTLDINVGVEQSKFMDSILKAAGKRSELVIYPDLEHSLVDSGVRADMLLKSARFLEANLR